MCVSAYGAYVHPVYVSGANHPNQVSQNDMANPLAAGTKRMPARPREHLAIPRGRFWDDFQWPYNAPHGMFRSCHVGPYIRTSFV
jgi:hypothetical protein